MSIQSGWWEIQNLLGGFLPFSGKLLIMKLLPAQSLSDSDLHVEGC